MSESKDEHVKIVIDHNGTSTVYEEGNSYKYPYGTYTICNEVAEDQFIINFLQDQSGTSLIGPELHEGNQEERGPYRIPKGENE